MSVPYIKIFPIRQLYLKTCLIKNKIPNIMRIEHAILSTSLMAHNK